MGTVLHRTRRMTAFIASVQTAQDAQVPPLLVLLAVLAVAITVIALTAPELVRRWRAAQRVIDEMPLPPHADEPFMVPRQLDRGARK